LSVVAILLGVFPACNENTVDPVFYGSLEGTVTFKSSGMPAPGVEITTVPATTSINTDDQGHFSLADIPTGEYSVVAKYEGYRNATVKVAVTRNNTTTANLVLEADASAPNTPQVSFPAQGAQNIARAVTLKWSIEEKNDDALTFDVVLFESNSATPLLDLKDKSDTLVNVTDLKFNTTYFWQVNAKNTAGTITHGPLWHFKTLPFPDNRYVFSSQRDGNYEIYSSDENGSSLARLTFSDKDQAYPRFSSDRSAIAYVENTNLEYHIYIMNRDGSAPIKVTTLPVAGNHNDGRGFCWSPDNGKLLYSHYDKLYTIDRNGSNLTLIATAPAGRNFRSCDWTAVGNRIVVETVGVLPYQTEIRLIDLVNATNDEIIGDEPGTLQSPSFSVDGNVILFTRDVSGFESADGRQLDSRPFSYNIATTTRTDLSKDKLAGTNDLHPRYSPDGAKIIFENRNNDGSGAPAVFFFDISKNQRSKLFDNAGMPDWR
jgi:TolB protein